MTAIDSCLEDLSSHIWSCSADKCIHRDKVRALGIEWIIFCYEIQKSMFKCGIQK